MDANLPRRLDVDPRLRGAASGDDLVRLRQEDVPCLRGRRVLLGEAEDVHPLGHAPRLAGGEPTGSKVTETRRLDLLGVVPLLHLGREDRLGDPCLLEDALAFALAVLLGVRLAL
jgi:hypothetical protein